MHRNSCLLFEKYAQSYFKPAARVLEIGPDTQPSSYERIAGGPGIAWETLDLAPSNQGTLLTYLAEDEYHFPVDDDRFDIVVSGQVIEHVRKVWVWIRELARACKPGGVVITICPLNWPYHEAPVDCWRIYPEGLRVLYDEAGLEMEKTAFEKLDDGREGGQSRFNTLTQEAQLLARRLLGRPSWPLGAFKAEYAVDAIGIGRKKSSCGSEHP